MKTVKLHLEDSEHEALKKRARGDARTILAYIRIELGFSGVRGESVNRSVREEKMQASPLNSPNKEAKSQNVPNIPPGWVLEEQTGLAYDPEVGIEIDSELHRRLTEISEKRMKARREEEAAKKFIPIVPTLAERAAQRNQPARGRPNGGDGPHVVQVSGPIPGPKPWAPTPMRSPYRVKMHDNSVLLAWEVLDPEEQEWQIAEAKKESEIQINAKTMHPVDRFGNKVLKNERGEWVCVEEVAKGLDAEPDAFI